MPQPETAGSERPDTDRGEEAREETPMDPAPADGADPDALEGVVDPSTLEIPAEPLPEPPVRITITPGYETDEDVEPGEEVPDIEVDVTTEPR